MKLLVTGGAGFIGSAVCRTAVGESRHAVVNVDKLTYAANLQSVAELTNAPTYSFHKIDICDVHGLESVFRKEEPDAVLHLAAESHVDRSISGPAEFITTNIVGTYTLLEATRTYWERLPGARKDAFRFLHVSTDEVYGSLSDTGFFTEHTPYDPSSPYSASKAASDHLALAWQRTYGLPVLLSNCSNNYGPYQFPEKLIPLMITNALMDQLLPVYGAGKNIRDWLYVEDHARALLTLLERGKVGQSYNVGSRSEHTNFSIVEAVCAHLDRLRPRSDRHSYRSLIQFVEDRPGHDYRYAIDPTKIETEIGWKPQETFQSGLEKTLQWYLANTDWWSALRNHSYRGERLGLLPNAQAQR